MTKDAYQEFEQNHHRQGTLANLLKLGIIEPLYRFFMQFDCPFTWITSLMVDSDIVKELSSSSETVYVTRSGEVAWQLMNHRANERGRKLRMKKAEVLDWYSIPGWVYDSFTHVIELEDDEFLCDLFGVTPRVTEAEEVENLFLQQQKEIYIFPEVRTKFQFGKEAVK